VKRSTGLGRRARVTALAGGVGAARLVRGVVRLLPPSTLSVVVNTGDDEEFFGLHVSPDVDTMIYTLADVAPPARGWGIADDSTRVLGALRRFYPESWFQLGDLDLATHIYRTEALRSGERLHAVTARLARAFGVVSTVLPMSNDPVRTIVETRRGERLSFQEYFVRRGARDPVRRLRYRGQTAARPAPGVLDAIDRADLLLLPPSNPFTSIRPIVGLRGVREALRKRRGPLVAVSPVAAGQAVRGPLGGMLRAERLPVSPLGIASCYRGLLDGMVIDLQDAAWRPKLEREGIATAMTDIGMDTIAKSRRVAGVALVLARELAAR
jgi:LPPG:FO 2-phospho-L-lactate transferase